MGEWRGRRDRECGAGAGGSGEAGGFACNLLGGVRAEGVDGGLCGLGVGGVPVHMGTCVGVDSLGCPLLSRRPSSNSPLSSSPSSASTFCLDGARSTVMAFFRCCDMLAVVVSVGGNRGVAFTKSPMKQTCRVVKRLLPIPFPGLDPLSKCENYFQYT